MHESTFGSKTYLEHPHGDFLAHPRGDDVLLDERKVIRDRHILFLKPDERLEHAWIAVHCWVADGFLNPLFEDSNFEYFELF